MGATSRTRRCSTLENSLPTTLVSTYKKLQQFYRCVCTKAVTRRSTVYILVDIWGFINPITVTKSGTVWPHGNAKFVRFPPSLRWPPHVPQNDSGRACLCVANAQQQCVVAALLLLLFYVEANVYHVLKPRQPQTAFRTTYTRCRAVLATDKFREHRFDGVDDEEDRPLIAQFCGNCPETVVSLYEVRVRGQG